MNALQRYLLTWGAAAILFAQPEPAFEAASVKPANEDPRIGIGLFTWPGGRITATKLTLKDLIEISYGVEGYQISGGPAWISADRFDIEVVPPSSSIAIRDMPPSPKTPPSAEVLRMLRILLADRFNLGVHRQTGQGPALRLLVAKGGPRLHAPANPSDRPFIGVGRKGAVDKAATAYVIMGQSASMSQLASLLSQRFKRQVLDGTGLTGNFDFEFEYATEGDESAQMPSIFAAMQESLGLRVESTRGPVDVLVIDHVAKLSAN